MKIHVLPLSPFKLLNIAQTSKVFLQDLDLSVSVHVWHTSKSLELRAAERLIEHWRRPAVFSHHTNVSF